MDFKSEIPPKGLALNFRVANVKQAMEIKKYLK
jgi:hypothetical protein